MTAVIIRKCFTAIQIGNCRFMAGHSKWANIKHTKALKDGQKSTNFTKISRKIRLSIQDGGSSDPNLNSILRNCVEDALRKNMPLSTINNVIKKCDQNNLQLQKFFLEMRAINNIFIVCSVYTDNLSGLKMNIAPILKKSGVIYMDTKHLFDENGIIETRLKNDLKFKTLDELEEFCTNDAIECGAEDIEIIDEENKFVNFVCNPIELARISKLLVDKKYEVESAEHVFIPKNYITVSEQNAKQYEKFLEKLKSIDGFDEIYDNLQPE